MKKLFAFLLALAPTVATLAQQTEMTSAQAKTFYSATSKNRVSIHDPSVVYVPENQRYYIFGSHKAGAYTTDLQNWTQANPTWNASNAQAFVTPAVKKVKKGGEEVDFPAFNAHDWSGALGDWNVDGNMWAPDVLWNEYMQKWCMYLSINGPEWNSSVILLTADNITGPYTYQGPVVITGFRNTTNPAISHKKTDLELVIGEQATLPSRYNRPSNDFGQMWGDRWPHAIDPCVFFDEEGELWMAYGSWSGGIWMLKLDKETGLRDYDVVYPSTNGSLNTVTSDPYFGKKVAGGLYVSGEGPYIEHIGQYYYLFVSYGGFAPDGGYEMRVFRSQYPDGPYRDASSRSAIFDTWVQNYGLGNDNRGEKIMGAYNGWGFQTVGETAQGHNSVIAAPDGRTYLIYHTKFNDGTIGHQVRTHQLFLNKSGWLVAAPFEYNGETVTDADIASQELVSDEDIVGTYQVLVHKYKMDYANMEEVVPVKVTLTADGKVSGAYTGAWSRDAGTSYLRLTMGGVIYNGVVYEQQMDGQNIKTVSFTAMATSGVNVWGYRMRDDYALAWQLNHQTLPVREGQTITKGGDYYSIAPADENVVLTWNSSLPEVISPSGRYNPAGLAEDTEVTLTARLDAGRYFWEQDYHVTAAAESYPTADWQTGMLAHYGFDGERLVNSFDEQEVAELKRSRATAQLPVMESDDLRNGQYVHVKFGANGSESYVSMPNPLAGLTLADGATLSFWVRCTDTANVWDALYGFYDASNGARLYMTGNLYTGFNNNAGNWLDINHPGSVLRDELKDARWHHVVVLFNRSTAGVRVYVDGLLKSTSDKYNGQLDGKGVTTRAGFDYNLIVNHLSKCTDFYLGNGSFWGSADACYDDVIFYDHVLEASEVQALNTMYNRVYDFAEVAAAVGISEVQTAVQPTADALFDLSGRRIEGIPHRGIYIKNGKKIIIK